MKVSTKSRYGVRFLMDLAVLGDQGNVTLKEIARRQSLSEKYLWQIVNPLKTAGVLRSVSGPGGGYSLARAPASITLREVVAVLEGEDGQDGADVSGLERGSSGNAAAAREIWKDVEERIAGVMASITLETLAEKQKASLKEDPAVSYSI